MKNLVVVIVLLIGIAFSIEAIENGSFFLKKDKTWEIFQQCPSVRCPPLTCTASKAIITFFEYKGKYCSGCPICSWFSLESYIRSPIKAINTNICPVPMCDFPGFCERSDYILSFYFHQGKKCPGCVMCPNSEFLISSKTSTKI